MKSLSAPTQAGERIRLARLQRGLSQENMADLLNLSTTAYGDIERGKTELTVSRLTQIASVLQTSVVALLSEEVLVAEPATVTVGTEQLLATIEQQRQEIERLRQEIDQHRRRFDDRIALELLRAIGQQTATAERERIGF